MIATANENKLPLKKPIKISHQKTIEFLFKIIAPTKDKIVIATENNAIFFWTLIIPPKRKIVILLLFL